MVLTIKLCWKKKKIRILLHPKADFTLLWLLLPQYTWCCFIPLTENPECSEQKEEGKLEESFRLSRRGGQEREKKRDEDKKTESKMFTRWGVSHRDTWGLKLQEESIIWRLESCRISMKKKRCSSWISEYCSLCGTWNISFLFPQKIIKMSITSVDWNLKLLYTCAHTHAAASFGVQFQPLYPYSTHSVIYLYHCYLLALYFSEPYLIQRKHRRDSLVFSHRHTARMWSCITDFFTYETTKSVVVKSWTIGIINRIVQLLIITYFIGWVFPFILVCL